MDVSAEVQVVAVLLPRDKPQCPLNSANINHNLVLKATLSSRKYRRLRNDSYEQCCTELTDGSFTIYIIRNYAFRKCLFNIYLYLNKITLLSFNNQNKFKLFLKSGRNFDSEKLNMVSPALSVLK